MSRNDDRRGNSRSINSDEGKRKKETITLAIDKTILDEIRKSSSQEGMSINAFINTILLNWTNFFRYLRESQAVLLTAKNFHAHLDHIAEDVFVSELKDNSINLVPAILAERKIPLTLDNVIEFEYKTFAVLGGAFLSVSTDIDGEGHKNILIRHNHGIKWSKIIAKAIPAQLNALFKYNTTIQELTPNLVRIKIFEKV